MAVYNSRTKTSQRICCKAGQVPEACNKIKKAAHARAGHIGNADETPVYFIMPSNVTMKEKGAETVN